jgi:hypothetical protein
VKLPSWGVGFARNERCRNLANLLTKLRVLDMLRAPMRKRYICDRVPSRHIATAYATRTEWFRLLKIINCVCEVLLPLALSGPAMLLCEHRARGASKEIAGGRSVGGPLTLLVRSLCVRRSRASVDWSRDSSHVLCVVSGCAIPVMHSRSCRAIWRDSRLPLAT